MSQGRQCWAAGGCGGLVTKTLNIETCGQRLVSPVIIPLACGESQLQCQVSKYNPVIM